MKDILDFIGAHGTGIFFFCLFFGGGIGSLLYNLVNRRHKRKMEELRYRYRLKILAERRNIAEIEGEAIKLLIADDALGEDFNRRLRSRSTPPRRTRRRGWHRRGIRRSMQRTLRSLKRKNPPRRRSLKESERRVDANTSSCLL